MQNKDVTLTRISIAVKGYGKYQEFINFVKRQATQAYNNM